VPPVVPLPVAPREVEFKTHWYGWQIMLIDAAALGVVATDLALGERASPVPGILGLGAYALGGPIVHLVHQRPPAALGSLGLRLALPVVGALIGATAENCNRRCTGGGPTLVGGVVGAVFAVGIDATLARERPPAGAALSFSLSRQTSRVTFSARF